MLYMAASGRGLTVSGAGDWSGCTARRCSIYAQYHSAAAGSLCGHSGPLQSAVCSVQRVASVGCAGPGGLRVTGLVSVRPRLQWSLGPPLLLRPGRASHHTWGGHGAARRPGPATRRQLHGSRLWLDSTARARMVRTSGAAACESPGAAPGPPPRCPRPVSSAGRSAAAAAHLRR